MLHLLLGLSALWSEMFHLIWSVTIYIFLRSFCFPTLSGASLNVDKYNNVYIDLNCCDIYRFLATSLPSQIVITSSGSFTLFCNIQFVHTINTIVCPVWFPESCSTTTIRSRAFWSMWTLSNMLLYDWMFFSFLHVLSLSLVYSFQVENVIHWNFEL